MERAVQLNKPVWFLNPVFDIIILAGFPIALVLIPMMYHLAKHFPNPQYYLYSASNFPHVFSTLTMLYLSPQLYTKRPVMFLWIPAILFTGAILFMVLGYFSHLQYARLYWGTWHLFTQTYFIVQLSKSQNKDYLKFDKVIDIFAVAIGPAFLMLYFSFDFLTKSALGTFFSVPIAIRSSVIIMGIIVAVFMARQAYLLIRWKKFYPLKIMLVSIGILTYFIPLMMYKSAGITRVIAIMFHSLQYLFWVWLFLHLGFKGKTAKEGRLASFLVHPGRAAKYIYFLLGGGVLFMFVVMGAATLGFKPDVVWSRLTYPLIFVHFWLDNRILIANSQIWSGA